MKRLIIFILALLFIVIGVNNGDTKRTMAKGNIICLECVGIG